MIKLGGIATSLTATVTGVTGNVVVNEYDVAGDVDVINGSGLTTISRLDHRGQWQRHHLWKLRRGRWRRGNNTILTGSGP
jgi:hypothetical protein